MADYSSKAWFDQSTERLASEIFNQIREIEQVQGALRRGFRELTRVYTSREHTQPISIDPPLVSRRARTDPAITENVLQNSVDAATAIIGKSRPAVAVVTEGGSWSLRRLAKHLEKYLKGLFTMVEAYRLTTLMFRSGALYGTGVLKPYLLGDTIKVDLISPEDIIVDESMVPFGATPLEMHQTAITDKGLLASKFPKHKRIIQESTLVHRTGKTQADWRSQDRMVLVIESWRLPTGDVPGKHTICVEKGCLLDEEYTELDFPFVIYHWVPPLEGFYGIGLAEGLMGFQFRLEEMDDFIRTCHDLVAVPRLISPAGSGLSEKALTNEIGMVLEYSGGPSQEPKFLTPTALNPETYRYRESIRESAFRQARLSELATQSRIPPGVEAARAIRELTEAQAAGLAPQQQWYEDAVLVLAKRLLTLVKSMDQPPKMYLSKHVVEAIDWPEVDFEKHAFSLQIQAASLLDDTPSGRVSKVIELKQYGVPLSDDEFRQLLGQPDLAAFDRWAVSSRENIEWVIEQLFQGKQVVPHRFQDLELGVKLVTAAYRDAEMGDAPEEILDTIRQWLLLADRILKQQELMSGAGVEVPAPGVPGALEAPGVLGGGMGPEQP